MFADDTFLFSVVHDIDTSENNLNYDLAKVSERTFLWKMRFNSNLTKQAPEIIFSKKKTVSIHPVVYFNNTLLKSTHKHLRMILDFKLSFENHLQSVFSRVNKTIGLTIGENLTYSSEKISIDNL